MTATTTKPSVGYATQRIALLGTVKAHDLGNDAFILSCRSGDEFSVSVTGTTSFSVVQNSDDLDRDRIPNPESYNSASPSPSDQIRKYAIVGTMVAVSGTSITYDGRTHFDAHTVTLPFGEVNNYVFEETHWWLSQISAFADQWLDDLFADRRSYDWDDFAELYRTNLNILGQPVDDKVQECATLSRLIYGLSSAYLLTGRERYYLAAKAGVKFQRETFASLSHDGHYCFWQFGKRQRDRGAVMIMASENPDDLGTIPLYEQIYALAGLTQFYRISQDWEVLEAIARTINTFQDFFHDRGTPGRAGSGGYFSHIDYATLRPDVDALNQNKLRKNWNSVGDHIPAYLINLMLALEPLPEGGKDRGLAEKLVKTCRHMLDETTGLILNKFPDPQSKFVNERFHANWEPDHSWGWQQNRGIVGHNFKIAWNMTRAANYYRREAARLDADGGADGSAFLERAKSFEGLAGRLIADMTDVGIDQLRGGCFDALERQPGGGLPVEFVWGNTKDFWQQEQAILAYLIHYHTSKDPEHLKLAREMMMFWNLYFLDHDNRGVYFRVTADGQPVIAGNYSQKAGHAVAGYHSFELNYLAHIYLRTYVLEQNRDCVPNLSDRPTGIDQNFCLFFHPDARCAHTTLNVLPDFLPPDSVEIKRITVGGVPRVSFNPRDFQIQLDRDELGTQVVVEFMPTGA